jgi:hypothetical protein
MATIVFLGWSAVVWLDGPPRDDQPRARARFKELTELTLLIFLATGAILTFDRLSSGAGNLYAALLGLKLVFGAGAYQYAFRWRRAGLPFGAPDGRLVLIFGAATVLVAAILQGVYDNGIRVPG